MTNADINYGLPINLRKPFVNGVVGVLRPSLVYYLVVEHNLAPYNILGALAVDLDLERHLLERNIVDKEFEDIVGHVIIEAHLPL